MNHQTLRHFFLVAPMIYAAIGRLAVQNFKPKQLADLKDTQERFRTASVTGDVLSMGLESLPRDHRRDVGQRLPAAEPWPTSDRPRPDRPHLLPAAYTPVTAARLRPR